MLLHVSLLLTQKFRLGRGEVYVVEGQEEAGGEVVFILVERGHDREVEFASRAEGGLQFP